jgi:glycolate oxidase
MKFNKITPEIVTRLEKIVGGKNIITGEGKENYSRDEAPHPRDFLPEVVVKPDSVQAVSSVMKLANRHRIPVTPRGAGTGLSGGCVPVHGGISLSLEKLNHILEVDTANFCVTAESGITLANLCSNVEQYGLYYPVYPGETGATIGGNVATNAGGMRAVKYGVTRNFVMGLEVVLPAGEIIRTGGKYIKSATGYDLTQLLIGSEGTLAVITQVILKLITPPGSREILLIPFNDLVDAIRFVPIILKEKIIPVSIEFMQQDILEMVKDYTGKEVPFKTHPAYLMLMIEAGGPEEFCLISEHIQEIALKHHALDVFVPGSERAKRQLLEIRENFYPSIQHRGMLDLADVVVPRSRIAEFVEKAQDISKQFDLPIFVYGHAGDGNVHLHPVGKNVDLHKLEEFLDEIYRSGINLGGTISGEHGLGLDKKVYFPLVASREKLELMKRIKGAFDPNNILNPGKIFD